jgi:hypothetical protein
MHKHGDKLTNACIAALVRTGQVSQAEVDRRKKAAQPDSPVGKRPFANPTKYFVEL